MGHPVRPATTASPAVRAPLARPVAAARRASARSTAPPTAVSFSRTAAGPVWWSKKKSRKKASKNEPIDHTPLIYAHIYYFCLLFGTKICLMTKKRKENKK
jgi:hypothetical protein